ncbi:MAG: hypothetical protein IT406_03250 [Candidatus Yanofskybacteria bacterium]|nr:hypothetical protein [Candidatus Yanofskybacteria bacterium]
MDPVAILAARRSEPSERHERPHFWPLILFVLVLLAVAVTTLGEPAPAPQESPTPSVTEEREPRVYVVSYRFGVFSPTNLRIHAGDTVRWRNDGALPIRVVAQLRAGRRVPEFDSVGTIPPDGYFSYTFATPGVFGYYNPSSEASETGVIIVR